ncbi:2588_t:CDS:2, partial [Dentiscutata heterogama]
ELGDHNAPPLIADIKTYDDGTILVHIIRNESTLSVDCSKIGGVSLEQKLRIRLIFLNGSVREIDPKLKLNPINSINYCLLDNIDHKINKFNDKVIYLNDTKNNNLSILHNLVNPITIYPLQKSFILVTYVKTNDTSNLTSYKECGEVIDWDGISRSDDYGNLTNLTDLTVLMPSIGITGSNTQYSLMSIVSTIESGYLTIFRYVQESNNSSLVPYGGGLFTIFIYYNQHKQTSDRPHAVNIYQITQPTMIIKSVDCDVAGIDITCIVSINSNNTTYSVQILLYSSGNILELFEVTNQTQQGLRAKIMPFNGYILSVTTYDNNDDNTYYYIYIYKGYDNTLNSSNHFLTNYFSANTITQNNTFLLALPSTNDNISWSLLNISLPNYSSFGDHGYDNVFINKTIPSINANVNSSTIFLNITFNDIIALSPSTSNIVSNITIYKASDNSIRQRISATMDDYCNISPDELTVSIPVIKSTFNEYGEQYFVTMDNNFVQSFNEPLKGIHDGIWTLKTDSLDNQNIYSDKTIMGSVRLTTEASKKFLNLSKHNQSYQAVYIDDLLNELAGKVPINRYCLRSDNRSHNLFYDQIIILIRIYIENNKIKRTTSE